MSFTAVYAGAVYASGQHTSIQNLEFWCSVDSTCSWPACSKISWWCRTSSVAMECSLGIINGWMAWKATGACHSWPPTQIAPSIRIKLSALNLLSFFTGLLDSKASSSSGKYCCWTYFMMAFEAVSIYAHSDRAMVEYGGYTALDLTNWGKCMIYATVLHWLAWATRKIFSTIISSKEAPAAAVVLWLALREITSLTFSMMSPTSQWRPCSSGYHKNLCPVHTRHPRWRALRDIPWDPSSPWIQDFWDMTPVIRSGVLMDLLLSKSV